ncbi:ABC transporter permease [Methylomagnum sp.]
MSLSGFSVSPLAMGRSFWRHRQLIWQMTRRDVLGRYRGSMMGILWSFLHPLVMLAVYTFVFSVVFKARWGGGSDSKTEFAILVFAGMIVHGLFAECVNRAPVTILQNVNYVKKVVFPLEILPWVNMGSALFHTAVSVTVLTAFYGLTHLSLNWTAILFPILIMPLALVIMGISWFLTSLGVYLRDLGQIIGMVTTIMMFLSPIFFPASALPEDYRVLLYLNPLAFMIEESRNILILGILPDWQGLAIYYASGLVVAWLGFVWFQKTRRGFADVL